MVQIGRRTLLASLVVPLSAAMSQQTRAQSGERGLGVDVSAFGARGDGKADDTAAIQAAIDHAISSRIQAVHLPEGTYRTTDTLHLGYGETFHQVSLLGASRASFGGGMPGVTIAPERTDRPCINIQGGRNILIKGVAVQGKLRPHIARMLIEQRNYSANPRDYLDAKLAPDGLDQFRPYAAITLDAYAGAKPANAYPDVAYPASMKIAKQYEKRFSSNIRIEDCDIQGFAVAFANQPCDADGNGDFTRIRDCQFGYCVYAIAICNGQSRNVEIRNCDYVGCHTFLTTAHFGRMSGQLSGPIDNISGGLGYQFMDIGAPGYTGIVRISNLYFESQVRIGYFGGGAGWPAPLVFDSCLFSFGSLDPAQGGTGVTPRAALESGSGSAITLRNCAFAHFYSLVIPVHFIGAAINGGTPTVVFENCTCIPGYDQTPEAVTPALAQAVNWFGGFFAQGVLNHGVQIIGANIGTYWPAGKLDKPPASQRIAESLVPPVNGERLVLNPAAREFTDQWGHPWRIRSSPLVGQIAPSMWATLPVQQGRRLSGVYSAQTMEGPNVWAAYKMEPGDILWGSANGQLFLVDTVNVNAVSGHYDVVGTLLNGYRRDLDGTTHAEHQHVPSSALALVKTGRRFSANLYFGDFTAGSVVVANVHHGNGYAGDLSAHVQIGDPLPEDPVNEPAMGCPTLTGTRITAVTNGSPGGVTLSRPALRSGRYPILPVLIG